ncbi:MAG: XRE family transcriptional regulator [Proteobacteria bacterium]|nr:XRE family transcriptional regulator [Pseudomonadota bacterium]
MSKPKKVKFQNPHHVSIDRSNELEAAIGREVKAFRKELNMTVVDLANVANLSGGMLSKIEHGQTSPSLATLQSVAKALSVPVTALFRSFEEERSASFVKAGEGLNIERRGTRAGHQYQLLGHTLEKSIGAEPYLITLTDKSDVFPIFQHAGVEFIYMLQGKVRYRHGDQLYTLTRGDSLFFEADAPHGPEKLDKLPIRFLSVIIYPGRDDDS